MLNVFDAKLARAKALSAKSEFLKSSINIWEFVSNDKTALLSISTENKLEGSQHKVLGLTWNNKSDSLQFAIKTLLKLQVVTKQFVLSCIHLCHSTIEDIFSATLRKTVKTSLVLLPN